MIVIKTEKQYRKELKTEYERGYKMGILDNKTDPGDALEAVFRFARLEATKRNRSQTEIDQLFAIVTENYKLIKRD